MKQAIADLQKVGEKLARYIELLWWRMESKLTVYILEKNAVIYLIFVNFAECLNANCCFFSITIFISQL